MNFFKIVEYVGDGGILIFILLMFIEWTPIKFNPIQWVGERFNKKSTEDTEKFRNEIKESVKTINDKLDAHIAESYRNSILNTQNRLIKNDHFTLEEWKKILDTCNDYHTYIEANKLTNDQVTEAIKFIKRSYQKCLDNNLFINLPN